MNVKDLFLVICLASAILYVTRHLVIYKFFLDNRDTHTHKSKNKKERDRELNSVPHGPSNSVMYRDWRKSFPVIILVSLSQVVFVFEVDFDGYLFIHDIRCFNCIMAACLK